MKSQRGYLSYRKFKNYDRNIEYYQNLIYIEFIIIPFDHHYKLFQISYKDFKNINFKSKKCQEIIFKIEVTSAMSQGKLKY